MSIHLAERHSLRLHLTIVTIEVAKNSRWMVFPHCEVYKIWNFPSSKVDPFSKRYWTPDWLVSSTNPLKLDSNVNKLLMTSQRWRRHCTVIGIGSSVTWLCLQMLDKPSNLSVVFCGIRRPTIMWRVNMLALISPSSSLYMPCILSEYFSYDCTFCRLKTRNVGTG